VEIGWILKKMISKCLSFSMVWLPAVLTLVCLSEGILAGESRTIAPAKSSGRLIVNPDGLIDSRGVPTLSDVWQFIQEHPEKAVELMQDSGQWTYLTAGVGIIVCHDAVTASGGQPVPAPLRKILRRWYPDDLLDEVRWTGVREPIRDLLNDARMNFEGDTLAITVMDAVIFRNTELAGDGALWAHELYHVQQYRKWGVFGFARKWVENPSVNGPIEAPAYEREAEARRIFSTSRALPIPQSHGVRQLKKNNLP
jgi:hypothetical protein